MHCFIVVLKLKALLSNSVANHMAADGYGDRATETKTFWKWRHESVTLLSRYYVTQTLTTSFRTS
jgi:hypothetical protein